MALSALLWPVIGRAALPPVQDASTQKRDAENAEKTARSTNTPSDDGENALQTTWAIPTVRFGGALSYVLRRDLTEEETKSQRGLIATLTARTNSFIWQPWFAQVAGSLGVTTSRDSTVSNEATNNNINSKSVIVTGNGQLLILPQSRYPFEAHFDRNDSRVSNELAVVNGYTSQRFGFTQHYLRPEGDSMIGWDRNAQSSDSSGRDQQDSLQLSLSHSIESHRVQVIGNHARNTHEKTGENAEQNNLSVQHSYAPDSSLSVESMLNLNEAGYHLERGDNSSHLMQLTSLAFWRPTDKPMTVTGGARLLALTVDTSGIAANDNALGARIRNGNVNAGVSYDIAKFTRINAGANVNLTENNGVRDSNTNQTAGVTYQPDSIPAGNFRYNWTGSAVGVNRTGAQDAGRQLTLQLSHNLSRSVALDAGSAIGMDVGQGVSVVTNSPPTVSEPASTKRLTHSGSLSWSTSKEAAGASVRLSASDSRTVGGSKQEFFQLVNFQASSNLPTGEYSSWTGNLTVQAVRQSSAIIANAIEPGSGPQNADQKHGFVSTSTGSMTYQQQRAFGVRRLRFVSDLRLNSQALLPLLGSQKDQETAAWENRFDYVIGRTQLRLNALISRASSQKSGNDPVTGKKITESVQKVNKSIMFSVTRAFGDF